MAVNATVRAPRSPRPLSLCSKPQGSVFPLVASPLSCGSPPHMSPSTCLFSFFSLLLLCLPVPTPSTYSPCYSIYRLPRICLFPFPVCNPASLPKALCLFISLSVTAMKPHSTFDWSAGPLKATKRISIKKSVLSVFFYINVL